MRVTLLGFTVPQAVIDEVVATDAHMPTQTHTFAWAVVGALREAGVDVTLLSAEPVTSFPGNPRAVVRGRRFREHGVEGRLLPFVNVSVVKHLTRWLGAVTLGTAALLRWRPDAVLVHGVHTPFLLAGRLYRRLLGIPIVTILTDPPGVVLPTDDRLIAALKRFDRSVVRWVLRRHDGVVVLTPALAEHFAPGAPFIVMEGIAGSSDDSGSMGPGQREVGGPAVVVYAGGLSRSYGVDRLVEAVRALPVGRARLILFGRGELDDEIRRVAADDERVDPPRFADRSEILDSYMTADVLVQPRPVEQDFVRFSFPSKLMEYLASGAPVVSTRLPGIPDDFRDHIEWAEPDDADGLRHAIERVLDLSPEERRARGDAARYFIRRTRGSRTQGRRLREFLADLAQERCRGR